MKTKLLLFATIGGIEPEGDFDASDQIDKYHFFTNDPNVLTELLEGIPQGFQKQIGEHSLKLISNSKASVFLAMPFENESELNKFLEQISPDSMVQAFQARLISFINFLWLVKDSDVYIRNLYFVTPKRLKFANSLNYFTSCRGEAAPVTFNRDEIKQAITLLNNYRDTVKKQKLLNPEEVKRTSGLPSSFIANKSRVARTLITLQVVRESKDLALKIAHYCSCFEILFLTKTEDGGITHLLAERMAFFLASSSQERIAVYEDVREAYRIRCGIFHGKFLTPKRQEKLERISSRCDEFLRETIRRILTSREFADHFADKDEAFDNYFRDLIFGTFPSAVGATSL
jgi:Apea-like HEPN